MYTNVVLFFFRKKCQMYEEKKKYKFTRIKLGKGNLSLHVSRLS